MNVEMRPPEIGCTRSHCMRVLQVLSSWHRERERGAFTGASVVRHALSRKWQRAEKGDYGRRSE